jgi:polyisoprenoid-binding protein YceI
MHFQRLVLSFAMVVSSWAFAGWTQSGTGSVSFNAVGPAGFKINGKGEKLTVSDDGARLSVAVPLASLETGIDLRNKHMLEDLEAEKFPTATLEVALSALKFPADGETVSAEARGQFGLHGQTKETAFSYKATCKSGLCDVEATAGLNVKDFGVKIRSYLGITVKPDLKIGVRVQLKR